MCLKTPFNYVRLLTYQSYWSLECKQMEYQELRAIIQEMAFNGKDSYEIEKELEKNRGKFSDESINLAKRDIDDYIVNFQLASQKKSKALNQILIGSFLFLIGIGVTGYTYFGNTRQYILAYGAILTGAWILKEGYKIYRKPIEELIPRRNIFRR